MLRLTLIHVRKVFNVSNNKIYDKIYVNSIIYIRLQRFSLFRASWVNSMSADARDISTTRPSAPILLCWWVVWSAYEWISAACRILFSIEFYNTIKQSNYLVLNKCKTYFTFKQPNQCVGGSNVFFKVAKLWQGYKGIGGCQKNDNKLKTWIASKI